MLGLRVVVISKSLNQNECTGVEIHAGDAAGRTARLKHQEGKDFWLLGGGALFQSLMRIGLVDASRSGPGGSHYCSLDLPAHS